ncbi:MAG: carboxypeptidase-like regulatory domain-containing protein [Planctomycetota bacterium]
MRAELEGYAPTEWGPFRIGADLRTQPIELRLGRGGTIEGRVVLPAGADPTGTIVAVHRGDGHARTKRVGADGAYRFDTLTPGSWLIEKRDQDILYQYTRTSPAPSSFEQEVTWNCKVVEGRTTYHDLRVGDPNAFRLEGTVAVGGIDPGTLVAWLGLAGAGYFDNHARPSTSPDSEGRFELGVPEGGDYRLVLRRSSGAEEWFILADVRLAAEVTPWSIALTTRSLVIEGLDPARAREDIPPFVFLWEGPTGVLFLSLLMPDDEGTCRLPTVPSGTGKLARPTMETIYDPRAWEVALEVQVAVGQESRVTAP